MLNQANIAQYRNHALFIANLKAAMFIRDQQFHTKHSPEFLNALIAHLGEMPEELNDVDFGADFYEVFRAL